VRVIEGWEVGGEGEDLAVFDKDTGGDGARVPLRGVGDRVGKTRALRGPARTLPVQMSVVFLNTLVAPGAAGAGNVREGDGPELGARLLVGSV
jgi:N-methylhydantoinase B/oxoprolinase/acetone carboxylase alpha subunit